MMLPACRATVLAGILLLRISASNASHDQTGVTTFKDLSDRLNTVVPLLKGKFDTYVAVHHGINPGGDRKTYNLDYIETITNNFNWVYKSYTDLKALEGLNIPITKPSEVLKITSELLGKVTHGVCRLRHALKKNVDELKRIIQSGGCGPAVLEDLKNFLESLKTAYEKIRSVKKMNDALRLRMEQELQDSHPDLDTSSSPESSAGETSESTMDFLGNPLVGADDYAVDAEKEYPIPVQKPPTPKSKKPRRKVYPATRSPGSGYGRVRGNRKTARSAHPYATTKHGEASGRNRPKVINYVNID